MNRNAVYRMICGVLSQQIKESADGSSQSNDAPACQVILEHIYLIAAGRVIIGLISLDRIVYSCFNDFIELSRLGLSGPLFINVLKESRVHLYQCF
jgi:hypothetical protein